MPVLLDPNACTFVGRINLVDCWPQTLGTLRRAAGAHVLIKEQTSIRQASASTPPLAASQSLPVQPTSALLASPELPELRTGNPLPQQVWPLQVGHTQVLRAGEDAMHRTLSRAQAGHAAMFSAFPGGSP